MTRTLPAACRAAALSLIAVLLALALGWAPAARAADAPGPPEGASVTADADQLTWSLTPIEKDGTARSLFDYRVKPGQVINDSIRVSVLGSTGIDFSLYGADAFLGQDGAFDVLTADKTSKDIGGWIEMSSTTLRVEGADVAEIPFTLTIPDNATPGDHIGGIVTSVRTKVEEGQGAVNLDRRLGVRVFARVDGPLNPGVEISGPTYSYGSSANPFGGRSTVSYTITNVGNTRLHANRSVEVGGVGGGEKSVPLPEFLPGTELTYTDLLGGPRLIGPTGATVEVAPREPLQGELPTSSFTAARASVGGWAWPWGQVALLLVLLVGGTAAVALRRHARPGAAPPVSGDLTRPADANAP